jgi:excisionase family DNA binding protein
LERAVTSKLLTVSEVAVLLGQKERTIRDCWRHWGLKAYRIGRSLRFREAEVLRWLDGQAEL